MCSFASPEPYPLSIHVDPTILNLPYFLQLIDEAWIAENYTFYFAVLQYSTYVSLIYTRLVGYHYFSEKGAMLLVK